jgi:hypothetical protein
LCPGESRSCSCPSLAACKVAATCGVFHNAMRCIASVFMGSPYGREAVDTAVLAESGRPASEVWLGLVHGMQELTPNPYSPCSGEAS